MNLENYAFISNHIILSSSLCTCMKQTSTDILCNGKKLLLPRLLIKA